MTTIPQGYRLALIDGDDTVVESVDVGGYNLGRPIERAHLVGAVEFAVWRAQEVSRAR